MVSAVIVTTLFKQRALLLITVSLPIDSRLLSALGCSYAEICDKLK